METDLGGEIRQMIELQQILGTYSEEILFTAIVAAVVLAVRHLALRWRATHDEEITSRQRLAVSSIIAAVTALGALSVIGSWGLGDNLSEAFRSVDLASHMVNVVLSVIILGSAYALSDFLGQVIKEFAREQDTITEHEREMLHRSAQVGIYMLSVLVVIGLFTDNLGGLLVGAGFLGVVVGMAARQTLSAMLAGFVLMFSRPFEVGDWIAVGDNEGTVTDITIVKTRIRSFDGEYVMIPNDEVSSNPIVNRSRRGRLRIEVEVGIDYDADPERAADVALEAVKAIDRVLDVPSPRVVYKRFGDSAIVLGVRFWIDNPSARRKWRAQTAVIGAVKRAFEEEGIEIPYPQRELSRRGNAGAVDAVGAAPASVAADDGESKNGDER